MLRRRCEGKGSLASEDVGLRRRTMSTHLGPQTINHPLMMSVSSCINEGDAERHPVNKLPEWGDLDVRIQHAPQSKQTIPDSTASSCDSYLSSSYGCRRAPELYLTVVLLGYSLTRPRRLTLYARDPEHPLWPNADQCMRPGSSLRRQQKHRILSALHLRIWHVPPKSFT